MDASDLVVNRWRWYGKDRLYVEHADGTKVGFWDLTSGKGHPEFPDGLGVLTAAVASWTSQNATPGATITVSQEPCVGRSDQHAADVALAPPAELASSSSASVFTEPVRPWVDLATNRPGAEAREQAEAARDSAPVKTVLARVLGVHTDERAWRIGAGGEEKVAAQLAKLIRKDPRWRVLHAIPIGNRGSDIDHLVIGPGGVFTVNAKHHPNADIWVGGRTFLVNGHKQPYIRNARHEAVRAGKLLADVCGFPVHVDGLIVTVNAADVVVKSQPEGVSVVPRMQLTKWLLRHGDIHDTGTVAAIYDAARRSTTWKD